MRDHRAHAIDNGRYPHLDCDLRRGSPDGFVGGGATVDDELALARIERLRHRLLHLLVINLLFVALDAIAGSNGAVLGGDNRDHRFTALLGSWGQ